MYALFKWITGFVILSLYVNGVPPFLPPNEIVFWVAYWAGFFILACLVVKFLPGVEGIRDFGLHRHSGWLVNTGQGFLIGFSTYAVKYAVLYGFDKFQVIGFMSGPYISELLITAAIAMFFSSILNDIVIRGFVYAAASKFSFLKWFIFTTVILYVLDDSWHAGFSWMNVTFSAILGLIFANTVVKTGSIWMSFGLHWGGNMMYRVMYGFDGQGVLKLQNQTESWRYELVSLTITALMLPMVYLVLKHKNSVTANRIV